MDFEKIIYAQCVRDFIGFFFFNFVVKKESQREKTEISPLNLSLSGIILRWGFLIWEFFFIYLLRTFCPHLGSFLITGDTVTRLRIPIRGHDKSPEEGQRWNLAET